MKIIHCADFHLDAPLAQLPPDKAALPVASKRFIDYIRANAERLY